MSEMLDKQIEKQMVTPPKMYSVIFINDDFTPMEFVVMCLVGIYHKTPEQAQALTLEVHNKGKAHIHQYPKDIALTKQEQTTQFALFEGHPLKVEVLEM